MSKDLIPNCKAKKLTFAENEHTKQICLQCWHLYPASDIVKSSYRKELSSWRIAPL